MYEIMKRNKPAKPITKLEKSEAAFLIQMMNCIYEYLDLNESQIDKYEFYNDVRLCNDLILKLQNKIFSCRNNTHCISLKSINGYERCLFVKYTEKGVIKFNHPLMSSLHAKLIPIFQQNFI
jgi:hypothetical protein